MSRPALMTSRAAHSRRAVVASVWGSPVRDWPGDNAGVPIRRPAKNVGADLGPLRLTLADLIEIESMLPEDRSRRITAGNYAVDRVEELRQSVDATLPDITFSSLDSVAVYVGGHWSRVISSGGSPENNQAAQQIIDFLRPRRVGHSAVIFTRSLLPYWVAWAVVQAGLTRWAFFALDRLNGGDPGSIAAFMTPTLLMVVSVLVFFRVLAKRFPLRHPIVVREAERTWIDRHGTVVGIWLSIVGIALAIYYGVRQ